MAGLRLRAKYPMDNADLYCGSRPFRAQQTTVFKAGQLYGTNYSGWKGDSCVSTRQNGAHWTMRGHARRSVWRVSRILGEKDPENGLVRVSSKKQNNGLWKRMPCTKSTAMKSGQLGKAAKRAVMFKSVAHAAHTKIKDIFKP